MRRVRPAILARARELRHPQTPAETKLWSRLRSSQVESFKFRRQHPIDRFIVDFYCAECRLVVEIDGDSHAEQVEYDDARTEWLQSHGYRVVRFNNRDAMAHTDAVIEAILAECKRLEGGGDPPSP